MEPVTITEASPEDAGEILTLQRAAYVTEAQLNDDPHLPPLLQTLPQLRDEFATSTVLTAVRGTRIVGAVRGRVADGALHVARLVVAPDQQGRGIGTLLLDALELRFASEVERFELFTSARSAANLRLYQRLGYRETRREPLGERVTLVFMAKDATVPPR